MFYAMRAISPIIRNTCFKQQNRTFYNKIKNKITEEVSIRDRLILTTFVAACVASEDKIIAIGGGALIGIAEVPFMSIVIPGVCLGTVLIGVKNQYLENK